MFRRRRLGSEESNEDAVRARKKRGRRSSIVQAFPALQGKLPSRDVEVVDMSGFRAAAGISGVVTLSRTFFMISLFAIVVTFVSLAFVAFRSGVSINDAQEGYFGGLSPARLSNIRTICFVALLSCLIFTGVAGQILLLGASNKFPFYSLRFYWDSLAVSLYVKVVSSFVLVTILSLAVPDTKGEVLRFGTILSVCFAYITLVVTFPLAAYMGDMLREERIIYNIALRSLRLTSPTKKFGHAIIPKVLPAVSAKYLEESVGSMRLRQAALVNLVERLSAITLHGVVQKDKPMVSKCLDLFVLILVEYGNKKSGMSPVWHHPAKWLRRSPDFLSLSDDSLRSMDEQKLWVEWKVFKQFLQIYVESVRNFPDLCLHTAINTRRIGEAAVRRRDIPALELCIKIFNTFIRTAINSRDKRSASNAFYQYRQMATFMLKCNTAPAEGKVARAKPKSAMRKVSPLLSSAASGALPSAALPPTAFLGPERKELGVEDRVIKIARFFRYYSIVCLETDPLQTLVEDIAHDLGAMLQTAYLNSSECHAGLLKVFLTVDDTPDSKGQETTLRGVRRAQIKMATVYLLSGAKDLAEKIMMDMIREPHERLRSIYEELLSIETRDFWEISDRVTNSDYLSPQQKAQLPVFFGWFENLDLSRPRQDARNDDLRLCVPRVKRLESLSNDQLKPKPPPTEPPPAIEEEAVPDEKKSSRRTRHGRRSRRHSRSTHARREDKDKDRDAAKAKGSRRVSRDAGESGPPMEKFQFPSTVSETESESAVVDVPDSECEPSLLPSGNELNEIPEHSPVPAEEFALDSSSRDDESSASSTTRRRQQPVPMPQTTIDQHPPDESRRRSVTFASTPLEDLGGREEGDDIMRLDENNLPIFVNKSLGGGLPREIKKEKVDPGILSRVFSDKQL